ncbi:transcriptional repressor LexA [Candidatus Kaiserbacteria bacterium]|nr:transcriptional repressor LexA [Candidatus Kaiserbacteria bacterium]
MADYDTYKKKILTFYGKHKRMPLYKEIMVLTGFRSKNAVFKLIGKMVEEGVVSKDSAGHIVPSTLYEGVPLLGLVEAGFPSAAEEELLDVMNLDEFLIPNKESTYILKVKGDSMIDAGIHAGDMVIVERKSSYKPGQIVIASVDNEFTMKYLRKTGERYYLDPANKDYKPIYPDGDFRIEAVVVAVIRKYQQ